MVFSPLVAPAPALTESERVRYSRHTVMLEIGDVGQRRLKNARVLVVGAGGLGSPVLTYLAAAGVGTLGIVDDDRVDVSNLQRQVVHGEASLGQLKTASAAERLRDINPAVTVVEHPVRLSTENAHEILSQYDMVIDGADNFATRYLVNEVCVSLGIPDVLGSVLRFTGQVSVFWAKVGPCYACVFPQAPAGAPSCADAGVFGALCGTVGSWMATEAIKLLVGVGDPLIGRLLRYDAQLMKVTELTIEADKSCPLCAQVPREETQRPQSHVLAQVSVLQLQDLLSARSRGDAQFRLVDIREPHEFEICQIAGAELIPQAQFIDSLSNISRDDSIVLFCRSGVRSAHALRAMQELGFTHASHLAGGILDWIDRVEPHQTKY